MLNWICRILPLLAAFSISACGAEPPPTLVYATITPPPIVTPLPPLPTATLPPTTAAPAAPGQTLTANPLGQVMILEYHLIEGPDDEYRRSPDNFRADMSRLYDLGYTPANLIDLMTGFPDLPPGRKPVILTFDDSDITQFNLLADGSVNPDSAVGILQTMHQQYGQAWPLKGTFFVLQDVDAPPRILFGQPDLATQKLNWLVDNGFEIGSHTISHFDLATGDDETIQWQLAVSQRQLEALLPGYQVQSLSAPFGSFPANMSLLAGGYWEGEPYAYANTVRAWGGPTVPPGHPEFNPYYISRVVGTGAELNYWLNYFEQNPDLYYVTGE